MSFYVEIASGNNDASAVRKIQEQVFLREMGIRLPELDSSSNPDILTLIARCGFGGDPVGTLTAVETTDDRKLNRRYGIDSAMRGRSARYSRLAVLRPYRGHNVPLLLLLEAQRHFIVPQGIQNSWLLFDAARATSSLMVSTLGFTAGERTVRSEYGVCRVLSRTEGTVAAQEATRRGWTYLHERYALHSAGAPLEAATVAAERAA